MGERYELFVAVLELVRVEALLPYFRGQVGRPEEDRAALARAFIAKAVFDIPTTRGLIERLEVDETASSAEVLAALLRRYAGARLIGAQTLGKDWLTRLIPVDHDWRLAIPAERIEVPGERLAQGLVPDIEAPPPAGP